MQLISSSGLSGINTLASLVVCLSIRLHSSSLLRSHSGPQRSVLLTAATLCTAGQMQFSSIFHIISIIFNNSAAASSRLSEQRPDFLVHVAEKVDVAEV